MKLDDAIGEIKELQKERRRGLLGFPVATIKDRSITAGGSISYFDIADAHTLGSRNYFLYDDSTNLARDSAAYKSNKLLLLTEI
jgi:hypothetical protein